MAKISKKKYKKDSMTATAKVLTQQTEKSLFTDFQTILMLSLVFACVLLIAGVYLWLAKESFTGEWLVADIIERWKIFSVDDSLRYYAAKSAFIDSSLYSSNYVLPVCLVLDGILAAIFNGDQFLMRSFHLMPAIFTLWFIYISGIKLGVHKVVIAFSLLILAAMPLYLFIFLSFYGENWLTLFVAAMMAAFFYQNYRLAAVIAAFIPLIRPEGLFLIAPLGCYFLYKKDIKNIIVMNSLGFIYFLYLLFVLPDFSNFYHWRLELRKVMDYAPDNKSFYDNLMFSSFNVFWTLPALFSLFMPRLRKWWPMWIGAFIWILWNIINLHKELTYYEARYFLSILPIITVAWAVFWTDILANKAALGSQKGILFIAFLLLIFIVSEHLLQLDPLKARYGAAQRWPVEGALPMVNNFTRYPKEEMQARQQATEAIYKILDKNLKFDSVVISYEALALFYTLDPHLLPKNVEVSFSPVSGNVSLQTLSNHFYVMTSKARKYKYFQFKTFSRETKNAVLFVGDLQCPVCKPILSFGSAYTLYAFDYDLSYSIDAVGK